MKKLISEQNFKKDHRSGVLMLFLVTLVALLSIGRVVIANHLVESSEKLRQMDKNIQEIQNTNQILAEKLRSPQSLTQIELKAKSLGFSQSGHLVFLKPISEVALLR